MAKLWPVKTEIRFVSRSLIPSSAETKVSLHKLRSDKRLRCRVHRACIQRIKGTNRAGEAAVQTDGHCSPLITPRLGQAALIALREMNANKCVLTKAEQIKAM